MVRGGLSSEQRRTGLSPGVDWVVVIGQGGVSSGPSKHCVSTNGLTPSRLPPP